MASQAQDSVTRERRVVVYIVRGRRAGLRRIIGHMVLAPEDQLPKKFQNVHVCKDEPAIDVHLVGEFPRYVLYREIEPTHTPKPRKRFPKVVVTDGKASARPVVEGTPA